MRYILICGSRTWTDASKINTLLTEYIEAADDEVRVVHGAARGADSIAGGLATLLGLRVKAMPADWSKGKGAGFERNLAMLALLAQKRAAGHHTEVWAFSKSASPGTRHTIRQARAQRFHLKITTD